MPAILTATALLTLDEGIDYLHAGNDQSDEIASLINRVSDYCQGPTGAGRRFVSQTFSTIRYPGQLGTNLRPLVTPIDVSQAITITLDAVAQTVWKAEADGDPALKDVIVRGDEPGVKTHFYRADGWLGATPDPIVLSYTGGYAATALPEHLKEAARLILAQWFREQTKGLQPDVSAIGAGPVAPGVTFRESLIPMRAREILSAYRSFV